MGVKFAKAFGAKVFVITSSENKRQAALDLGADGVILSRKPEEFKQHKGSFHFILDTVSADHDLNEYLSLLRHDGKMVLVGLPEKPAPISAFNLVGGRKTLAGSMIGGIKETQEMLDFCAKHGITSDIEMINIRDINTAYERMIKGDVKYRFVIDMQTLKA